MGNGVLVWFEWGVWSIHGSYTMPNSFAQARRLSEKRVELPKLETALPEFWEMMVAVAIINKT